MSKFFFCALCKKKSQFSGVKLTASKVKEAETLTGGKNTTSSTSLALSIEKTGCRLIEYSNEKLFTLLFDVLSPEIEIDLGLGIKILGCSCVFKTSSDGFNSP